MKALKHILVIALLACSSLANANNPAPGISSNWLGLHRLEQTFTIVSQSLYTYKARYLLQTVELLRTLPAANTGEGTEARGFVLVALDPFMSDLSSPYFERTIQPHYRSMRTFLSEQRGRSSLSDFAKSPARVLSALMMIKAALESTRDFVNVTDELVSLRALLGQVGRAIAADGDATQVSALLAMSHDTTTRTLLESLSTYPRTRGLGLSVMTLMEYLQTQ